MFDLRGNHTCPIEQCPKYGKIEFCTEQQFLFSHIKKHSLDEMLRAVMDYGLVKYSVNLRKITLENLLSDLSGSNTVQKMIDDFKKRKSQ